MFQKFHGASISVIAIVAMTASAGAVTLTNGSDEGDVTVEVDLFGQSRYALFDPVGPVGAADVFYDSDVQITQGSFLTSLGSAADSGPEIVSQTSNEVVSTFTINQLGFTLRQSVNDTVTTDGLQTGSILRQAYTIRNLTNVANSFSLIRYLDADLYFDGSLIDGGGRLLQGATTVLFQTDATGAATDPDTFVGITASEGNVPDAVQQFAVAECCGVDFPLSNDITGDSDGDGFIDSPYDVTMALQGNYTIAPGATATFTTNTLFGNDTPPAPGSSETLPLLPTSFDPDGEPGFGFDISPIDLFGITEDDLFDPDFVTPTIWIDPPIAVGYTYDVTGAEFNSVTAPTLAAVNDPDGYFVEVDGVQFALLPGETFLFTDDVINFSIIGIDPSLGLDPTDPTAFAVGVTLKDFTSFNANITQTPLTVNPGTTPIPLPAPIALLGFGLLSLSGLRRLSHRRV